MEKSRINGDEGAKNVADGIKTYNRSDEPAGEERNPNSPQALVKEEEEGAKSIALPSHQSSRTLCTDFSQIDADLALARTLQEQETAYMILRMTGEDNDYGRNEVRSPNAHRALADEEEEGAMPINLPSRQLSRTLFTEISQIDADLALARTLQEQEASYMVLRTEGEDSDYGSWETESFVREGDNDNEFVNTDASSYSDEHDENNKDANSYSDENDENNNTYEDNDDEDAFDVISRSNISEDYNPTDDLDPSAFSSDEAYARALQDAEERELAVRLLTLTGISDRGTLRVNSRDVWEQLDPDELSYEELIALGEVVGTESRGLSADKIACLPAVTYKLGSSRNGINDSCVICRVDYEDGESLTRLHCGHLYHPGCLNNWLEINKSCPVCNGEVCPSGDR